MSDKFPLCSSKNGSQNPSWKVNIRSFGIFVAIVGVCISPNKMEKDSTFVLGWVNTQFKLYFATNMLEMKFLQFGSFPSDPKFGWKIAFFPIWYGQLFNCWRVTNWSLYKGVLKPRNHYLIPSHDSLCCAVAIRAKNLHLMEVNKPWNRHASGVRKTTRAFEHVK